MLFSKTPKKNAGFTLIETIITLGIFLLIITAVTAFVAQGFRVNRFTLHQSEAISQARKGMDSLVKEIREASPAENGSYPIETADDQNLIFYSDIDADELVEKIRYFLDGTDLKKSIIEPTGFPPEYSGVEQITTISQYIRNDTIPLFYYYNRDYPTDTENNPLTTPAAVNEIKLIRIFLEVNVDPGQAPEHFILISNSQIRNLKDNL